MNFTKSQKKALRAIYSGKHVFLTGGAGTGKTAVIKEAVKHLQEAGKSVLVCAPTAAAATLIGGCTIHRAIGLHEGSVFTKGGKIKTVTTPILRGTDCVIVDEVSMCRTDLFEALSRSIWKCNNSRAQKKLPPIQLVVCGDFYQLPPVLPNHEKLVLEEYYSKSLEGFAFESPTWFSWQFKSVILTETCRQIETEFVEHLNELREGQPAGLAYFNQRVGSADNSAVYLYARNTEVTRANLIRLEELPGESISFDTLCTFKTDFHPPIADLNLPENLILKTGARVMVTVNEQDSDYKNCVSTRLSRPRIRKLCTFHNGTLGTVIHIEKGVDPSFDSVAVKIDDGDTFIFTRKNYDIYDYAIDDRGVLKKIIIGSYSQIPVKLAYAATIHRAQGQTYDKVNVDPSCFAAGQLYVALSRVKKFDGLHLLRPITPQMIITSKAVREFYSLLGHRIKRAPSGERVKMGRPIKYHSGAIVMTIPKPLIDYVRAECNDGKAHKLKEYPPFSSSYSSLRVPVDLVEHVKQEIKMWRAATKKQKRTE